MTVKASIQIDKIKQVQAWTTPIDVHDVRVFLGLTSYYRQLVKNYADIDKPLVWANQERS